MLFTIFLILMFKGSGGTFSKKWGRFPNKLERNKLKENRLHLWDLGSPGPEPAFQDEKVLPSACRLKISQTELGCDPTDCAVLSS